MPAIGLMRSGLLKPPATSLWTPDEVAYPGLWFDAKDAASITHSANAVSQWNDKSGNGLHFTQASPSARPTWNGTDAIASDGNDMLETSPVVLSSIFPANPAGILAFVIAYTSGTIWFKWQGIYGGSSRIGFEGSNRVDWPSDSGGKLESWSSTLTTTHKVLTIRRTATNMYARLNGVQVGALTDSTPMPDFGTDASPFYVFDGPPSIAAVVSIKSIVVCGDSDLTTTEKIEGYLAHRFGLSGDLDAGHPYKSAPPSL